MNVDEWFNSRFYNTRESAQTHLSLWKQALRIYPRQKFGPGMFIVYRLIQSRKHQRRYFTLKDVLSTQYCREKKLHYLWSKTARVQWLVREVSEVTCAHCKSWIAECMAASHWWGKKTEVWEAGRERDGADCQSTDSSSGVPFRRWFQWHILSSVNQHLQMKCSPEHFKPAVVMGFLWSH